jgi:hypothetical protein
MVGAPNAAVDLHPPRLGVLRLSLLFQFHV